MDNIKYKENLYLILILDNIKVYWKATERKKIILGLDLYSIIKKKLKICNFFVYDYSGNYINKKKIMSKIIRKHEDFYSLNVKIFFN